MWSQSSHLIGPLAGQFLLFLAVGCGDTAADPISEDALAPDDPSGSASGGDDPRVTTGAVLGLCGACDENDECGDNTDHCVSDAGGSSFCARDCSEGRGCPDGYNCVEVRGSALRQCVPHTGTCEQRALVDAPPALRELRSLVLFEINSHRAELGLAPWSPDDCLDEIAQSSVRELALTGQPFTKYGRECEPLLPGCACGWFDEVQLLAAAYGLEWRSTLDEAVEYALSGQSRETYGSPLAPTRVRRIGVGVVFGGDEAWFSFTYAD